MQLIWNGLLSTYSGGITAKELEAKFFPLQSLAQKTPGSLLVHTQAPRLNTLKLPYHMPPDEYEDFKLTTKDDRDIAWLIPKSANWNLIPDAYDWDPNFRCDILALPFISRKNGSYHPDDLNSGRTYERGSLHWYDRKGAILADDDDQIKANLMVVETDDVGVSTQ